MGLRALWVWPRHLVRQEEMPQPRCSRRLKDGGLDVSADFFIDVTEERGNGFPALCPNEFRVIERGLHGHNAHLSFRGPKLSAWWRAELPNAAPADSLQIRRTVVIATPISGARASVLEEQIQIRIHRILRIWWW